MPRSKSVLNILLEVDNMHLEYIKFTHSCLIYSFELVKLLPGEGLSGIKHPATEDDLFST